MPPYDDAYYEQVPYEELYDAPVRSSDQQSSSSSPSGQQPSGQQFASEQPGFSQHDAMTNASPVVANVTPEGALRIRQMSRRCCKLVLGVALYSAR